MDRNTARRRRSLATVVTGVIVLLGAAVLAAGAVSAASDPTGPAETNFNSAYQYSQSDPIAAPAGSNNYSCKPSAAHPYPVVLVHGTAENRFDNWADLSPQLAAAGYCVFALDYGGDTGNVFQGLHEIGASAGQLSTFIDGVLLATGTSKVDIVGHSQGGMMPRYYIKNLGGASKVNKLVALVPSNHGTTANGIAALGTEIPGANAVLGAGCEACVEQEQGSSFITALNAGGETSPAVTYTVITTTHDEVVTPYTSAFLAAGPAVTNQTLQDYCPSHPTEHVAISYDQAALQLVFNALDPAHATTPTC